MEKLPQTFAQTLWRFLFFHYNYNINDYHINSTFYLECCSGGLNFAQIFSTDSKAYDYVIWNNCNI